MSRKKERELSKKKKESDKKRETKERKKERKNFDTEGDDDDDDDDVRTITLNSTLLHARKEHVTHAGAALAAKIGCGTGELMDALFAKLETAEDERATVCVLMCGTNSGSCISCWLMSTLSCRSTFTPLSLLPTLLMPLAAYPLTLFINASWPLFVFFSVRVVVRVVVHVVVAAIFVHATSLESDKKKSFAIHVFVTCLLRVLF